MGGIQLYFFGLLENYGQRFSCADLGCCEESYALGVNRLCVGSISLGYCVASIRGYGFGKRVISTCPLV